MDARREEGGWEAAIDPALAARLLRPAVRPGISDPAYGRRLAARLRGATPPTLADDAAERYGSAALGGSRPPVVYAAPLPSSAKPGEGAADIAPSRAGTRSGDAGAAPASVGPRSAPVQAKADAPRPVVRAGERTAPPAFPPPRPLGAGPAVQRRMDPAAAVPVVPGRPSAPPSRAAAAGGSAGRAPGEVSAPARPVVAAAPTRLRRRLAAEHAEAAQSAEPAPLRVRARPASPAGGGGGEARAPAGPSPGAADAGSTGIHAADRAADSAGPGPVRPAPASAPAGIVQRAVHPHASPPPRVVVHPVEERDGGPTTAPIVHAKPVGAAGGAGDPGDSAHPAPPVVSVPRSATAAPAGQGTGPVQRMTTREDEAVAGETAVRVVHGVPRSSETVEGGGRSLGSRPVVAAPAGRSAGAVQRMPLRAGTAAGGTAARLVHREPAPSAAPAAVQRASATAVPPAGAPPAELPTATAGDARPGPGDTARLAEQVYDILVRRLESERRQRGW